MQVPRRISSLDELKLGGEVEISSLELIVDSVLRSIKCSLEFALWEDDEEEVCLFFFFLFFFSNSRIFFPHIGAHERHKKFTFQKEALQKILLNKQYHTTKCFRICIGYISWILLFLFYFVKSIIFNRYHYWDSEI